MRHFNPWLAAALIALLALLVAIVPRLSKGTSKEKAETAKVQVASARGSGPEERCTSERTYDAIKGELFRSAAQARGGDRAAFDKASAYSVVRMERPLLTDVDEELGTIRCSGHLSLDLPPGLAVAGARRTLSADIDYVLQPAADGSGDVVMLEGDAPVSVPLATLGRSGSEAALAEAPVPPPVASPPIERPEVQPRADRPAREPVVASRPAPSPAVRPVAREPVTASRPEPKRTAPPSASATTAATPVKTANVRPSFNCRYARTKGETAVCTNGSLASLDRQMASKYYRAIASADASQRQTLSRSRDAFLRRRDRCGSDACVAATYNERIQEIAAIAGR